MDTIKIDNLSLTIAKRFDINLKHKHDLINRIKKFKRQIHIHKQDIGFFPTDALKAIHTLEKDLKYFNLNYLITNKIKIQKIKYQLNKQETVAKHWNRVTGLDYYTEKRQMARLSRVFLDNLEAKAQKAARFQAVWRLKMALEEAIHNKWYIIFNTLTIAPEHYNKVWIKNSKLFKQYIEKFDSFSNKQNHNYFGVVEEGGVTNREHFHVVHMVKQLPTQYKGDPNRNMITPTNRIIDSLRPLWSYGFSTPIAVRTTASDPWAQLQWIWPVTIEKSIKTPIQSGSIGRLANYMSKYITKNLTKKGTGKWKTRQRQGLGLTILKQTMQNLKTQNLNLMIEIAKMGVLTIHHQTIPRALITSTATQELLKRSNKNKLSNTTLMTLEAQPSIMKRLTTLTQITQKSNTQNTGTLTIQNTIKDTQISKINQDLPEIQELLDKYTKETTGYITPQPSTALIKGITRNVI